MREEGCHCTVRRLPVKELKPLWHLRQRLGVINTFIFGYLTEQLGFEFILINMFNLKLLSEWLKTDNKMNNSYNIDFCSFLTLFNWTCQVNYYFFQSFLIKSNFIFIFRGEKKSESQPQQQVDFYPWISYYYWLYKGCGIKLKTAKDQNWLAEAKL